MQLYSDDELLNMILAGGKSMDNALTFVYGKGDIRRQILAYLKGQKIEHSQAEDYFQEAVKIFILAVRKGKFKGESNVKNYLFGVCKNLKQSQWMTDNRRRKLSEGMINETEDLDTPDRILIQEERKVVLNGVLKLVGEKCQRVLQMWRMDYSMKEIAEELVYKSEGMARKKKHECMKKLMALVKQNPELMTGIL